ncbi:Pentapeptide repeats (8 copies) [Roseovarius tolerans]|uniref:Pentapeptide repeats (8 copies) n=1 Tax=Roseovarius tolerans TaxID=74031 RepID=A0A0L6CZE8_9RHOB|nr:pentapeptide repeat-containing protein [Roseovarius tolerans]KNX43076.1 Pentapeptide repeats (8 copies) [Roseovarius tolerans]
MLESFLTIATHPLLWIFIGLTVVFYGVQWVVGQSAEAPTAPDDRIRRLAEKVGMTGLHPVLFLILLLTWGIVAGTLFVGLYAILWQVIFHAPPEGAENIWNWRFTLAQLVALTTVLGAVIALPITINRLILTRRQTDTVEQGHITDRINKAVEGLGAVKEVNRLGRNRYYVIQHETGAKLRETDFEWRGEPFAWPEGSLVASDITDQQLEEWKHVSLTEPNIEVRIGAIYALERISQDSARDHIQIMEILCAYVRQNAPKSTAIPFDISGLEYRPEIYKRLPGASEPRVDIQAAISVVSRRKNKRIEREKRRKYRIDLRGCNLQNADFGAGNWRDAIFDGSVLDQANLASSDFENASFAQCSFENTHFTSASLDDVSASGAKFRFIQISEKAENFQVLNNIDLMAATFDQCEFSLINVRNQFHVAELKNSRFIGCEFGSSWFFVHVPITDLKSCTFQRCAVRKCEVSSERAVDVGINGFFGDGSVKIALDQRPSFWPRQELSEAQFQYEWRKWQDEGPDYTPPEAPEEG